MDEKEWNLQCSPIMNFMYTVFLFLMLGWLCIINYVYKNQIDALFIRSLLN
jgi:hypothetical protein